MKKQPFSLLGLSIPTLLLVFLMTTTTSCKKVEGCTDTSASNYDSLAEEDDGSCTFQGEVVFWYTQSVSETLVDYGISSMGYYVGGVLEVYSASSVYYLSEPSCGDSGTITVARDLGTSKTKQYVFKVEDRTDKEILWQGIVTFEANTCVTHQLQN